MKKFLLRVIGTDVYDIGMGGLGGSKEEAIQYTEEEIDKKIARNASRCSNGLPRVEKVLVT